MRCTALVALSLQALLASTLSVWTKPGPARLAPVALEALEPLEALEAIDPSGYGHPAWLQSCSTIFLDVGSNLGVQVRKLFEPEKYPKAQLLADFTKYLGAPEERLAPAEVSGLCALGLEPNPAHYERLKLLEFAYAQRGWHAHFYPFAAWAEEGLMALNTTAVRASPDDTTGLGVHLQSSEKAFAAQGGQADLHVRTVSLAEFIRSLPAGSVRLMKMDIEGAEWETLAQLLKEDMLCDGAVQSAFVEVHPWGETKHWGDHSAFKALHPRSWLAVQERIRQLASSGRCPGAVTKFSQLDDESYPHDVDDDFRGVALVSGPQAAATGRTAAATDRTAAADADGAQPAAPKNKEDAIETYAIRDGKIVKIDG